MIWAVYALIAGIFFSGKVLFSKKILDKEGVAEYLYWYSLIVLIICVLVSLSGGFGFLPVFVFPNLELLIMIIFSGVLLTAGWFFLFNAYQHMHISEIAPLTNLVPVVLVILSMLFLGEQITGIQGLGILIIVIATYFIEHEEGHHGLQLNRILNNPYFEAMILYLIIIGFQIIIEKIIIEQINFISIITIEFVVMNLILLGYLLRKGNRSFLDCRQRIPEVFVSLLGFMSSAFYLSALALPGAMVSLIIPVKKFDSVLSTLLGGRMYKEEHIKEKVLLTLLMIIGIYLIVMV